MTVGERMLLEDLAAQVEKKTWAEKLGPKIITGIVAIFILRAMVEILVQNFLHRV